LVFGFGQFDRKRLPGLGIDGPAGSHSDQNEGLTGGP
jgi:hypothetical protein